jgi:hypothetical protein
MEVSFDREADAIRMAKVAAEFAGAVLFPQHRGVINCDDRFVLFGNDGYETDIRSQREVEIVLDELADHEPVLGVNENGITWAVVLTDFTRMKFDEDELRRIVWDAWMSACDEQLDDSSHAMQVPDCADAAEEVAQ